VTLRARWVTLRARWVTLRARWVTLRARWVTLSLPPWPPQVIQLLLKHGAMVYENEALLPLMESEIAQKRGLTNLAPLMDENWEIYESEVKRLAWGLPNEGAESKKHQEDFNG
jgi:hypothetical protein